MTRIITGTSTAGNVPQPRLPLTLWWSSPVWLHAGMISRVGPKLWVPNYIWAVVVLVGMPVCAVLGGLLGADPDDAQSDGT